MNAQRLALPIWAVVIAAAAYGMFQIKFAVQTLERDLGAVERQIADDQEALRVLRAEYSYLNDPARLAELNRRHLGLAPVAASQMAVLDEIPLRPAPGSALPGLVAATPSFDPASIDPAQLDPAALAALMTVLSGAKPLP